MPKKGIREYDYTALRLLQQPGAPIMYLFGADAPTLLEWADVPNAKADYMAGYQRVYNPERAQQIQDFLAGDPKNIIPGAIIVTINESAVKVDDESGDVVRLSITLADHTFNELLEDLYARFYERLSPDERASIDRPESLADTAGGEGVGDGEIDDNEEPGIPDSYLASLTAELRQAVDNFEGLPEARQSAIGKYIESVSKPGLIIDGQHRVFGAKDVSQHDVRLPVVLLPGLSTGEQVFHFYVLNNKAKPLTAMELRRTISTALTNSEIDALWQRFEDAGVNPQAVRWTHKANNDSQSPFKGLIDFGLGGGGFIKENVAYQLITKFVGMSNKYRSLYQNVPAFTQKSDDRLRYFYAFWSAIRERYERIWNEGVAAGGSQLFYKASMIVLQEFVLDQLVQLMNVRRMEDKPSPFEDLEDLQSVVKAYLSDLPPAFFTTEWQEKQLDTNERRAFLKAQIQEVIEGQGKNIGNRRLFRKQA